MLCVVFSDTHGYHHNLEVPEADALIFAGDLGWRGTYDEVKSFAVWLGEQPHKHKIVVAGNHDRLFQREPDVAKGLITGLGGATYLRDEAITIDGIKFYGSPWQPEFCEWAFNLPRNGIEITMRWDMIPDDTDFLITHGPPFGIGDKVPGRLYFRRKLDGSYDTCMSPDEYVGCAKLLARVKEIKPQVHIFGHIHEGSGEEVLEDETLYMNVAHLGVGHVPFLQPKIIEVNPRGATDSSEDEAHGGGSDGPADG